MRNHLIVSKVFQWDARCTHGSSEKVSLPPNRVKCCFSSSRGNALFIRWQKFALAIWVPNSSKIQRRKRWQDRTHRKTQKIMKKNLSFLARHFQSKMYKSGEIILCAFWMRSISIQHTQHKKHIRITIH